MNMQENKHCFSTLNSPNTFRFKGVLQNGAEKGLNPAKSLISSCKVILSGWQLCKVNTLKHVQKIALSREHTYLFLNGALLRLTLKNFRPSTEKESMAEQYTAKQVLEFLNDDF